MIYKLYIIDLLSDVLIGVSSLLFNFIGFHKQQLKGKDFLLFLFTTQNKTQYFKLSILILL